MLISILFYSIIAGTVVWCVNKIKDGLFGPLASLPGPWHSMFTRLPMKLAVLRGRRTFYVHGLHEKYGSIVRVSPHEVSISDVSDVKTVYRVASPYLKDPEFYQVFGGRQKYDSLFTMIEPVKHGVHRRFQSANLADRWIKTMEPFVKETVQTAISKMHRDFQEKGYFDAYRWFLFMATDSLGQSAFGKSFETLKSEEDSQYMKDLRTSPYLSIIRLELGPLYEIVRRIPFKFTRELHAIIARLSDYSDQSIQRYLKLSHDEPDLAIPTLLSKEYKAVQEGSIPYEQLKRDGTSFIIAGTDTTGLTCVQAVWHISQNPEVHARIVEEVTKLPADFTDEQLRKIPYLQHVINETLRIAGPAADRLPRVVPKGGAKLSGHFLPGGTVVASQSYTLHLNPKIFVDPYKFDPSRWETATNQMKESFMPFGGGSRICIGMHFAQQEIRHALANFYRTFQKPLTAANEEGFSGEEMKPQVYFLSSPIGQRCLLTEAATA